MLIASYYPRLFQPKRRNYNGKMLIAPYYPRLFQPKRRNYNGVGHNADSALLPKIKTAKEKELQWGGT